MIATDYDRVLARCLREIEAEIARLVDRAFEGLPPDARELPFIGGWPFLHCERAEQKQLAVKALLAKQWFRFEAPRWAQPLPLTAEACVAVSNGHHWGSNHRALLRARYGQHARGMQWNITRMTRFEVFCANELAPPASPV